MNTKVKGNLGELIVATDLIKRGYNVSFPYGENTVYDLIAEKSGICKRVQVKAVYPKNGVLHINCKSSNNWSVRSYTKNDFEILAAVDLDSLKVYFIPPDKIGTSLFNIRLTFTKNNQKKNINIAEDFLKL